MFSGANDFSNFYNACPSWIFSTSVTPNSKLFSFLHLQDDGVGYQLQYDVLTALNMFAFGDDSTLVDNVLPPYSNSHCLFSKEHPNPGAPPITPYHNCTAVDMWTPVDSSNNPIFIPVWQYMLTTDPTILSVSENFNAKNNIVIFPNPTTSEINILFPSIENTQIEISNALGQVIIKDQNKNKFDISNFTNGLYFISVKQRQQSYTQIIIKK